MENKENEIEYQFNAVPMNLMACCDLNCRSMLWTLVQLSSYYADNDGWFFRTNEDLRVQSQLSENLVRATISTFYRLGIVEVQTVGKGKSKTPNKFRLNVERFKEWEQYGLEDCIKHPDSRIETDSYKTTGWQPSYLKELNVETMNNSNAIPTTQPILSQSEDNIDNTDNKENKLSEGSKQAEVKSNEFEEYKKQEDYLMDKLYNVSMWTDFQLFRMKIKALIATAPTEKVAKKTRARYRKIEEGKIKYLKSIISKQPYNSFYSDFYREYDCGWLGKEQEAPQSHIEEEDENAFLRGMFETNGWDIPDSLKPKQRESQDFSPIDDDNLPF